MKKTIQLADIETQSHWILDKWTLEDPTVLANPCYISSLGETSAAVSGSCGEIQRAPAYQAPKEGQDPMCSLASIPISNNSDPFDRWIRLAA